MRLQIKVALETSMAGSIHQVPGGREVYLAAALCVVMWISFTAIAVWSLDDSDSGGRLVATPWSCCLADR
jgi:hypothetical protein